MRACIVFRRSAQNNVGNSITAPRQILPDNVLHDIRALQVGEHFRERGDNLLRYKLIVAIFGSENCIPNRASIMRPLRRVPLRLREDALK